MDRRAKLLEKFGGDEAAMKEHMRQLGERGRAAKKPENNIWHKNPDLARIAGKKSALAKKARKEVTLYEVL